MNDLLFCVGCVLGCIQRHPIQSTAALCVCLGRAMAWVFSATFRLAGPFLRRLGQAWRAIDGPFARAVGPVVGLVVLVQGLAESPALAH